MTKDELLANIRRERARLDTLVSSLSDAQMVAPELDADWSVKDVLAHISAWERLCVKWIREGRRDEEPLASIDAFNDGMYRAHREQTLDAIRAESRLSYEEIVQAVQTLNADLAAAPAWATDAFTGAGATATLGQEISWNSDEHYREHIEQIEAWLRGRSV